MKPSLLELGCRLGFFFFELVKEKEFREELDGTKFQFGKAQLKACCSLGNYSTSGFSLHTYSSWAGLIIISSFMRATKNEKSLAFRILNRSSSLFAPEAGNLRLEKFSVDARCSFSIERSLPVLKAAEIKRNTDTEIKFGYTCCINFLSQLIFVFLLFLGMVMYLSLIHI